MSFAAVAFHWGLHAWAGYAVVGLALAFFAYNRGLPLALRSAFYPLLGERVWGWPGHIIDTLAVFATLFGLRPFARARLTTGGSGGQQVVRYPRHQYHRSGDNCVDYRHRHSLCTQRNQCRYQTAEPNQHLDYDNPLLIRYRRRPDRCDFQHIF